MHPYANAVVMAWRVRHLHSAAIEDDTYYGDHSEVTDRGREQALYLVKALNDLKLDLILCSPALRATTIIREAKELSCPVILPEPALGEWPRAAAMIGRKNSEPKVEAYLESRIRRFGTKKRLVGEESLQETIDKMEAISETLIGYGAAFKARLGRPGRIGLLSHGNRNRQFGAWALAHGDPKLFVRDFRHSYNTRGIDPATILPPLWYGRFFRSGEVGWNLDEGINWHLPEHLRDSPI